MTRCDPAAAGTASRHGVGRRKFLGRMIAVGGALAPGGIVSRLSAQSRSLASVTLGDGFELFYEVHGDGPPVVFAHGGGGTRMSWWQQIPAMSEHFRCITFDHCGFGHSRDVGAGPGHKAFDRLMSPAEIEEMHRKVPSLEFALVPGAGHSVYYEMPGLFNRLVIEFLKRHTARATR